MRRLTSGLILAAALLAACGRAEQMSDSSGGETAPPMVAEYDRAEDGRASADPNTASPAPGAPNQPAGEGPAPVLYLAYTYGLGIEAPSARVPALMDAHVQACQEAGARLCQIISSSRSGDPESSMQGELSLRAEPQWLRTFMGGIAAQVDDVGGRIDRQTTGAEDLTRQIVDTEARLRAQTTLRDRLQELLRSRPGRLADLLEVERELARVQGEIDAVQSHLAVMRTRVAMSELNIHYHSAPRPIGSDTMQPLRHAFADFLGVIVAGFAGIVYLIAGLIPIAVVVAPLVWLLLRWRKRRGGRFFNRRPGSAPPPPAEA